MNVAKVLTVASLATVAAFTSAGAFAQTLSQEGSFLPEPLVATKTRAQVQAELVDFKKGANPWSNSYDQLKNARSERSRDEVRAEAVRAREQIKAFTGEDSGSAFLRVSQNGDAATRMAGSAPRAE